MSAGRPDPDIEAEFARIISGWDDEADLSHRQRDGDPGLPAPSSTDPDASDGSASGQGARSLDTAARAGASDDSRDTASGGRVLEDPAEPATTDLSGLGQIPVWRGSSTDWNMERADALTGDDHFEPKPPEPLPPYHDWRFWGVLLGLVGGPVLLLVIVALRPGWGSWVTTLALAMTVGGFLLLVLRGTGPRRDDPDGGARV